MNCHTHSGRMTLAEEKTAFSNRSRNGPEREAEHKQADALLTMTQRRIVMRGTRGVAMGWSGRSTAKQQFYTAGGRRASVMQGLSVRSKVK